MVNQQLDYNVADGILRRRRNPMAEDKSERKPHWNRRTGKKILSVYATPEEHEILSAAAEEDRRSLSDYILIHALAAARTSKRRAAQKKDDT